jgi:metal-dependent amidase/aminoacylase/carboxypeptidase family protein
MPDFAAAIDDIRERLIELRHELHAHPELAFRERRTATRILTELHALPNLRIRSGLAGTGILATLNVDRPGPCVALRAHMDALPLQEDSPHLPYASQQIGRMHACGHDGNMACLVGAATVLSRFGDELPGKVKFLFQPSEESADSGRSLVDHEGVLENPKADAVFSSHGWPDAHLGKIIVGHALPFDDPICARIVTQVAADLYGTHAVVSKPTPSIAGEDFAFFAQRAPSAWYWIGLRTPDQAAWPALRSPDLDFADAAIDIGVRMHCEVSLRFLNNPPIWRCG